MLDSFLFDVSLNSSLKEGKQSCIEIKRLAVDVK